MSERLHAPSAWHVIRAIARRELGIAFRRKLVRLLFLLSAGPPLVFGVILIVRLIAKEATGMDIGWDPVFRFLQTQVIPVALLALGLGTPLVARDRAEDVLYLYAVRPVSPWHYAAGKLLAVALPTFLLLLVPGMLIAVLRQGLMSSDVSTLDSLVLVGKVAAGSLFVGVAFAGVSVGPSAATKRARWALFLALAFFWIPDTVGQILFRGDAYALGPGNAAEEWLDFLFEGRGALRGVLAAAVLLLYGAAGAWVTRARVRKEMIP